MPPTDFQRAMNARRVYRRWLDELRCRRNAYMMRGDDLNAMRTRCLAYRLARRYDRNYHGHLPVTL